jgi:hypothetical protein
MSAFGRDFNQFMWLTALEQAGCQRMRCQPREGIAVIGRFVLQSLAGPGQSYLSAFSVFRQVISQITSMNFSLFQLVYK